jgi:hypothetical protein
MKHKKKNLKNCKHSCIIRYVEQQLINWKQICKGMEHKNFFLENCNHSYITRQVEQQLISWKQICKGMKKNKIQNSKKQDEGLT